MKPKKLVFAPGAFDSFEGSQEELDELLADIQRMFEDGTLFEELVELTPEEFLSMTKRKEDRGLQ